MKDILSQLPSDLCHKDPDEAALEQMPSLADRMRYHTKRIRAIDYADGANGVRSYKAKFPEAKTIQVISNSITYQPKPQGYDDFLVSMVAMWFNSPTALAETNRAAVARLNDRLGTQLDPDKHFSQPLSSARLKKVAKVFAQHGAHLDTSHPLSVSKIRAAARAAQADAQRHGAPFGNVGHIIGERLTIGARSFPVERHNGQSCIRIAVSGARVRLRLDALEAFIVAAGLGPVVDRSPITLLRSKIGEPAPNAGNGDFDPLADEQQSPTRIGEPAPEAEPPTGELAPSGVASFAERIARCRGTPSPSITPGCGTGPDPLLL